MYLVLFKTFNPQLISVIDSQSAFLAKRGKQLTVVVLILSQILKRNIVIKNIFFLVSFFIRQIFFG